MKGAYTGAFQHREGRFEAARILGVSRVTVWKWMKKFDIGPGAGPVE